MKLSIIGEYIRADLLRYSDAATPRSYIAHYARNRSFRYCLWFRLCEADGRVIRLIAALFHNRLSKKFGIQIPRHTRIGKGLYIGHSMSLIMHPLTVIGENCNLSQFTTIGSNNGIPASIGNNVYIGPGCSIVEDVTIGDNAIIGAGSVVVKDVPSNCTAAGNPAKVISGKHRGPANVIIDPDAVDIIEA
jgi:serine O-acetyltransferase